MKKSGNNFIKKITAIASGAAVLSLSSIFSASAMEEITPIGSEMVFAPTYSDLSKDHPYYPAIMYFTDQGVLEGYQDGTFQPDKTVSRSELLKIVALAEGFDFDASSIGKSNCFDDISGHWSEQLVCQSAAEGYVQGDAGTDNFSPDRNVNMAEAAKMMMAEFPWRFSETEPTPWYREYMAAVEDRYLIPTSITAVGQEITRGEAAELLYRMSMEYYLADKNGLAYNTPYRAENGGDLNWQIKREGYSVSENSVYYLNKPVVGANPETFETVSRKGVKCERYAPCFWQDGDNLYYKGLLVEDIAEENVTKLSSSLIVTDSYFINLGENGSMPGFATLASLGEPLDRETLELVHVGERYDSTRNYDFYFVVKDVNGVYVGAISQYNSSGETSDFFVKLEGANPSTFTLEENPVIFKDISEYYSDDGTLFLYGDAVIFSDGTNSYVISRDDYYTKGSLWARDYLNVEREEFIDQVVTGRILARTFLDTDPSEINYLTNEYFTVGNKAFFYTEEIVGADVDTFRIELNNNNPKFFYYSYDSDSVYYKENKVEGVSPSSYQPWAGGKDYYLSNNKLYSANGEYLENLDYEKINANSYEVVWDDEDVYWQNLYFEGVSPENLVIMRYGDTVRCVGDTDTYYAIVRDYFVDPYWKLLTEAEWNATDGYCPVM